LAAASEAAAGVELVEPAEPESLPLAVFDSVFVSGAAVFSVEADSAAETLLPPPEELPFDA
jgi:hypothetical protein